MTNGMYRFVRSMWSRAGVAEGICERSLLCHNAPAAKVAMWKEQYAHADPAFQGHSHADVHQEFGRAGKGANEAEQARLDDLLAFFDRDYACKGRGERVEAMTAKTCSSDH